MVARRHILSLLTLAALLVGPFGFIPDVAQAATVEFLVDKLFDTTSPAPNCNPAVANDCSLRDAIGRANTAPAGDIKVISFELFTGGTILDEGDPGFVFTINSPAGVLPSITANNVQIEADTVFGIPLIQIDGNGREVGLRLQGSDGLITGLSLYGFSNSGIEPFLGSAIYITGARNRVQNSFIGVNRLGAVPPDKANFSGIRIDGAAATGNVIGGPGGSAVANFISGNTQNGVIIRDASGNFVQNNIIGLARENNALVSRGNGQYGVQITSLNGQSQSNTIGGASTALANVIGDNGQAGVLIRGSGTTSTTLLSNYIGIDKNTDTQFANRGIAGVLIESGSSGNTLAGTATAPLVVSGNSGHGVLIRSFAVDEVRTAANAITGAYIGTTRGGVAPLPNEEGGVLIVDSVDNLIQGSGNSVRIAGNGGPGITVSGPFASGNRVAGALVGVVPIASGSDDVANAGGVLLRDGASDATIAGNIISGNGEFGLQLSETETVTVTGNFIGLDLARSGGLPNFGPGIDVFSSTNTLIGGAAEDGNYIAANSGAGLVIGGSGTFSTTVDANTIGLLRFPSTGRYTAAGANGAEGVLVQDGPRQTLIGGTVGNIIGGAAADDSGPAGLRLLSSAPDDPTTEPLTVTLTTVSLNTIGAAPNDTLDPVASPFGAGIVVEGAGVSGVDIFSNTVRLNAGDGLRITAAQTVTVGVNNTISDNAGRGVFVNAGAADVEVISNTIRANGAAAVRLEDPETSRVTIRSNRMAANGAAVELVGAAPYDGEGPDVAVGPNHDIDPPFNIQVTQAGLISGRVYTSTLLAEDALSPVSACVTCTIQVFRPDPSLPAPDGQGWELVPLQGGAMIVPDASGNFTAELVGPVPSQLLFAATDGYGNTSEFAVFTATAGLRIVPIDPASAAQDAAPGQTVTYTVRLENTGSLALSNIQVETGGTLPGWTLNRLPAGAISVPGFGELVLTYTLTLPTGSNQSVQVPISDTTTITATAFVSNEVVAGGRISDTQTLTTTVLPRALLRVAPARGNDTGLPGEVITYTHRLFNDGNISVTVQLDASTLDPANSQRVWQTELDVEELTLLPGQSRDINLRVTVPETAQANLIATHYLTATAVGYPDQTRLFSDTTRVLLRVRAEILSDEEEPGQPGGTVEFFHTVRNTSNGTATFQLEYESSLGSTVEFFSETSSVPLGPNNTFTLSNVDNPPASINRMQLRVVVTLNRRLLPRDQEVIRIYLRNPATGERIQGATVIDRINITGEAGLVEPRLWLPMIFNDGATPPQ